MCMGTRRELKIGMTVVIRMKAMHTDHGPRQDSDRKSECSLIPEL
jgi:hypothetical protein